MTPPAEWNVMDLLFPVVVSPLEGLRQEAAELMCGENNDCPCKRVVCTYPKCEAGSVLD